MRFRLLLFCSSAPQQNAVAQGKKDVFLHFPIYAVGSDIRSTTGCTAIDRKIKRSRRFLLNDEAVGCWLLLAARKSGLPTITMIIISSSYSSPRHFRHNNGRYGSGIKWHSQVVQGIGSSWAHQQVGAIFFYIIQQHPTLVYVFPGRHVEPTHSHKRDKHTTQYSWRDAAQQLYKKLTKYTNKYNFIDLFNTYFNINNGARVQIDGRWNVRCRKPAQHTSTTRR